MKKLPFVSLLVIFSLSISSEAQHSAELSQPQGELGNSHVLMALSAHPDDEDGATLAYYRMKYGVKTYSVFFTRGEGGQNEIGPELYKDLGVIRTKETEDAARILGSEVYFLNFLDFGFSKTATETFAMWGGREEVLKRLVYIIRKLKPDVIITNHNPIQGHGNHQAVAISAIEAFDAASDPSFAPEQLEEEGVDLWQPKKFFWRAQRFSGEVTETVDVFNSVGVRDSIRGKSYQEIAAEALSMHKSQGMDRFALSRFLSPTARTAYRLIRSSSRFENDSTDFFGGIQPLRGEDALGRAGRKLRELAAPAFLSGRNRDFLASLQSTLADSNVKIFNDISGSLNAGKCSKNFSPVECRTAKLWSETLRNMIGRYYDFSLKLEFSDTIVVPGQRFTIKIDKVSPRDWRSKLTFELHTPLDWKIEKEKETFTVDVPRAALPTLPLVDGLYRSYQNSPQVILWAFFNDSPFFHLEIPSSIGIAPQQTLSVEPKATRMKERGNEFQFKVHNYFNNKTAGRLQVDVPQGCSATPADFVIEKEDGEASGKVIVLSDPKAADGDYRIIFHAHEATDTVIIRKFGVNVAPETYVGIVKSYDNTLESALSELGAKFRLLDENDLLGDLQMFSSIIIDIRAYLVREDLKKNNARLLQYVKDGGNLIVLYQKDIEWKSEYAPYPLSISRERVVDETAPIRVLQPNHPLFTSPNKISLADWDGWVQERGLYFPGSYSKEYIELLSCNDPDEKPLNGGYLVAPYGKGMYIYTSYVWYRQWKDAHPGALRNLANMISLFTLTRPQSSR
jgi:LmbE family N-acetylglucosaminyl deacetylase